MYKNSTLLEVDVNNTYMHQRYYFCYDILFDILSLPNMLSLIQNVSFDRINDKY